MPPVTGDASPWQGDDADAPARSLIRNRVLLLLSGAALLGAGGLAFLTHAPNRLVSGQPIGLFALASGVQALAFLPGLILLAGSFLPQRRPTHWAVGTAAATFLVVLCWLAGAQAVMLDETATPASRTSLGAGFWVLFTCAGLALADATHRLHLSAAAKLGCALLPVAAIVLLAAGGALDQLSLAKEYDARRDVLLDALVRHVAIVLAALGPTLLLGMPLGVLAARRRRFAAGLFPVLNIVQTIPSIALFAMLMAPLSGLAALFPSLAAVGISGIGLAPALIALVLYSLLPIVRNVSEGIAGVSPAACDAARGMGMTRAQVFWRVELPLAMPVILSGFRIVTVQAIGLTAVAALIGAGGLGSIMFQGLFANALDTVVLGTIPIIFLALAADAGLRVLAAYAERAPR